MDKRILIVEDEAIIATNYEIILQRNGFTVAGITDRGAEVDRFMAESGADLIIMDIFLKDDVSGIDAAKMVRMRTNIPILFISGNSDRRTEEEAVGISFSSFLKKPVRANALVQKIGEMLGAA